ncbi:MAG: hypothetical protein J6B93_04315 [Clostridia bacterium]|nr:hypothetical protein [Clostridia bacterium]
MKRIISIILSLAILASALSITSMLSVSAEDNTPAEQTAYRVSDTYLFKSPDTGTWLDWLYKDADLSSASAGVEAYKNGGLYLLNGPYTTAKMLDRYNAPETSVENFEWAFTYAGVGSKNTYQVDYYMFHVNKDSVYRDMALYDGVSSTNAGLASARNLFVLARSCKDTDDGLKAGAITVLQPTFDEDGKPLGLRPISYTEKSGKIIPDESAYITFKDIVHTDPISGLFSLKITLMGDKLTVNIITDPTRSPNGKEEVKSKTFTLSEEALKAAPAGDFVVSTATQQASNNKRSAMLGNITIREIDKVSDTV